MEGVLKHRMGFKAEYLEERKTEDIERRIVELGKSLRPGDVFVFSFSGHGLAHNDDQLFLLPGVRYEALNAGRAVTGGVLSWQTLKQLTSGKQWAQVSRVFIIDACRLPLLGDRSAGSSASFDGKVLLRDPILRRRAESSGVDTKVALLNACGHGQSAAELPTGESGLFSKALIEELEWLDQKEAAWILDDDFVQRLGARVEATRRKHPALLAQGASSWPTRVGDVLVLRPKKKKPLPPRPETVAKVTLPKVEPIKRKKDTPVIALGAIVLLLILFLVVDLLVEDPIHRDGASKPTAKAYAFPGQGNSAPVEPPSPSASGAGISSLECATAEESVEICPASSAQE